VIAQAIAHHRGGRKSDADGKSILDHLVNTGLAQVQLGEVGWAWEPGG
jgi:hypothetical protein